jgi:xylan 1,4-beta-xylosidase
MNQPVSITNPILPGFNPDPSICRVGEDYYIATSTFEWFPGVQIHHSRDLVHWRLLTRPLTRARQLDMRGNPDSCGIWAPCLTHADGQFWLIYTDVKRKDGLFKDTPNYLVTAPSIEGPWSDPVYLNASGFDPSLFHDADGRKWLANMVWDHRHIDPHGKRFGGILLQEYSMAERKLVGPVHNIFRGTALMLTEGPHIYQRDGWYYLLTAEGGTGYTHAVTLARARTLTGPYELHPQTHVLTAMHSPDAPLQRTGHGDMVDTPAGDTYMVHLCSRPLPGLQRSPLGRETAIQKIEWGNDGWPRLSTGGLVPTASVQAPALAAHPWPAEPDRTDFNSPVLPQCFQWLRSPQPERLFSLTARLGALRLYGRESPGSWFEQSLVARRQTSHHYSAETRLEFAPQGYQQFAGLTCYYNRCQFHMLAVTAEENGDRVLSILSCPGDYPAGKLTYPLQPAIPLPAEGAIRLGVDVDGAELRFRFALDNGDWQQVGPVLDASILSDEAGIGEGGNFTGAFVGMAAYDLGGTALPADFAYFIYKNR